MIKELVKDEAILSQVCTPATTDDAQVADDLVETLTSMDGAAYKPLHTVRLGTIAAERS